MASQNISRPVDDVAAGKIVGIGQGFDKGAIVAEANVLALRPVGDRQVETAREATHFALFQLTQRKERVRQLILRQRE